jgi:hypothetical protein
VNAIAVSGSRIFAGGRFDSVGPLHRRSLAAVDARSGQPTAWNPIPTDFFTNAVQVTPSAIYAGGIDWLRAFDPTSGKALHWRIKLPRSGSAYSSVHSLAVAGGAVYAGGDFGLAAFRPATPR